MIVGDFYSAKPKGDEIRICLDSGANCKSRHDVIVSAEDLGFKSRKHWDRATSQRKMKAVQAYFQQDGWPEFSWDD